MKGNTELKAITQALYFILTSIGATDKLKLVKLLFLADKYHLMKYGRTITGDEYYAMPHGPAGSLAMDILNTNSFVLDSEDIELIKRLFKHSGNKFEVVKHSRFRYDYLSETDIESLNYIMQKYGEKGTFQLRDYTHKFPEWKQHEDAIMNRGCRRISLKIDEMFSVLPEGSDPLDLPKALRERSKKIFHGAI